MEPLGTIMSLGSTMSAPQPGGFWPHWAQTPHLAPLNAKGGLRLAPRGLQTAGSMLRDVGRLLRKFGKIATGFRVFGFEILSA